MLILFGAISLSVVGFIWLLNQPVFGSAPQDERLTRIRRSANFREGQFQNPVPTLMQPEGVGYTDMLKGMIVDRSPDSSPGFDLPVIRQDLHLLDAGNGPFRVIWFGHSSYLLLINGKRILVDPVFSERTSPVSFIGTKRFRGTEVYNPGDIPAVDLVVLTHDHYDHLDYETIRQWHDQEGPKGAVQFLTSLGVGQTLEKWGISRSRIRELDWWEEAASLPGFSFTGVPSRHFSGRSFKRNQTLWSGFVLETGGYRILLGGDSGYGPHFSEIGKRFGSFNLVFLECGQYNEMWPYIHMMPEETILASKDLNAGALFPVHWGKYALALHAWDEPIRRASVEAERAGIPLITPKIGEIVTPDSLIAYPRWWEDLR